MPNATGGCGGKYSRGRRGALTAPDSAQQFQGALDYALHGPKAAGDFVAAGEHVVVGADKIGLQERPARDLASWTGLVPASQTPLLQAAAVPPDDSIESAVRTATGPSVS